MDITAIADTLRAAARADTTNALTTVLQDVVADSEALAAAMPRFEGDELAVVEEDDLSVYFVRFAPGEMVPPHDHRMAAFIGVFEGTEVNRLYRRRREGGIEMVREKRLGPGDTLSMGGAGIHAVYAAGSEPSLALHVYLGNLKKTPRSIFHPDTGEEMPFTEDGLRALTKPAPG